MKIPLYDPSSEISMFREQIDNAISDVLNHGQFILGPEVDEFESNAASYLGVKHAIGVNSGTDALKIVLNAMGIKEGDEVITSAMSFFATAEAISQVGAKPVFIDIEEASFNIDPQKIEAQINDRTKAILPVHLFGKPAAMKQIGEIAENYHLKVVEDCAQSFGAFHRMGHQDSGPHYTGSIGDAGTFSFFPSKNLGGIGDGGLITTNDDSLASEARALRVHGATRKYHNEKLGYNSRLDTIQAAFLNIKLMHIDELNQKRRQVADYYNNGLSGIDEIKRPEITDGHVFHQYTIRVLDGKRDALQQFLKENGISTNIYFPIPLNELKVYEGKGYPVLPVAHETSKCTLSLPIWPHIGASKLNRVIDSVKIFFNS